MEVKGPVLAKPPPMMGKGIKEQDLAITAQAALQTALQVQLPHGGISSSERKPNDVSANGSGGDDLITGNPILQATQQLIQIVSNSSQNELSEGQSTAHNGDDAYQSQHLPPRRQASDSNLADGQKLPALRPGSSDGQAGPPRESLNLPGFGELGLNELAEAASHNRNAWRSDFRPPDLPRRSFSSSRGRGPPRSPLMLSRPQEHGGGQNSPISPRNTMHHSPLSPYAGGMSPHSPKMSPTNSFSHYRTASQPSEPSPSSYSMPLPSTSTPSRYPGLDNHTRTSYFQPTTTGTGDGTRPALSLTSARTPGAPTAEEGYRCTHPGCNAPPFQTQYLLNSHANVHSSARPHYCPVAGCPRAEGGKGFKRKNEMIRHGLVHESPGYACPFCPDKEHKYPRPDNLQRHVRVHHVDKDKDDPALREVLAQRAEGASKGRRRRTGG